jgi:hypothetical protein
VERLKSAVVRVKPTPLTVAHCSRLEFHSLFWKMYSPLSIEIVPVVAHVDWAAAGADIPREARLIANAIAWNLTIDQFFTCVLLN